MTRTHSRRRLALALSISLLVVACGSSAESPLPSASASPAPTATAAPSAAPPSDAPSPSASALTEAETAAIYDAIEDQVLAIRGLEPVDVERRTIDADTLKAMNAASFDEDYPPEYIAANERLLKALGLLEEEQSLKELYLDLLGASVAGFYRPDEKTLYVVARGGGITGADKITFAHEYTHALQDASFPGLFAEQEDLLDQSDMALARASLYEGDATLLMSLWAIPNMTPAELQEVVAAGSDPESTEILARTPAILTQTLLFPYNAGISFLTPIQTSGDWAAVDDVYADLPVSTEQILHPEKYDAGEAPIEVEIPSDLASTMGDGWEVSLQDTLGEFQMQVWLQSLGDQDDRPSGGWGGDRLAVLEGPDGAWALAWHTAWDTAADATEFEAGAVAALRNAGGPAGVFPGEGGTHRWVVVGSDDAVFEDVAVALGLAG